MFLKLIASLHQAAAPVAAYACQRIGAPLWSRYLWPLLILALTGLSAQAQTSLDTNQAGANSRIDVLGALFTPPPGTAANQSRPLVYRTSDSTAVAMVPAMPQQFSLSGDALFAFGKSDKAGLTQEGLSTLDQLIAPPKAGAHASPWSKPVARRSPPAPLPATSPTDGCWLKSSDSDAPTALPAKHIHPIPNPHS